MKKFTLFWGNYEVPQIENFLFQRESSSILRLPFLSFGVLLGLAALGLRFLSSRWRGAGPLILLPLIHSLVISSFFVVARYRISVVPALMALAAAGLAALPGERVDVVNLNNGSRLQTYAIPGERGSGTICPNGGAARLAQVGDKVIILVYRAMDEEAAKRNKVCTILVDENNKIRS